MTAEERCRVVKDIYNRLKDADGNTAIYLEEQMYAVKNSAGLIVLIRARSEAGAIERVSNICNECAREEEPLYRPHEVAAILAEMFDDDCACNCNGIDEWLPEKCEVIDSCPNTVGAVCWEQFLKHRAERKENE